MLTPTQAAQLRDAAARLRDKRDQADAALEHARQVALAVYFDPESKATMDDIAEELGYTRQRVWHWVDAERRRRAGEG